MVEIAPLHFARAGHTATLLSDGDVVIAGGERAPGQFVRQTEVYRAAQRQFQYVADGAGRIAQTALRLGTNRVIMLGAKDGHCTIIFDAKKNSYRNAGSLLLAHGSTLVFRQHSGRLMTLTVSPP